METQKIDLNGQKQLFDEDILSKLKECKGPQHQLNAYDNHILPKLKNQFDFKDQRDIKKLIEEHQADVEYRFGPIGNDYITRAIDQLLQHINSL